MVEKICKNYHVFRLIFTWMNGNGDAKEMEIFIIFSDVGKFTEKNGTFLQNNMLSFTQCHLRPQRLLPSFTQY